MTMISGKRHDEGKKTKEARTQEKQFNNEETPVVSRHASRDALCQIGRRTLGIKPHHRLRSPQERPSFQQGMGFGHARGHSGMRGRTLAPRRRRNEPFRRERRQGGNRYRPGWPGEASSRAPILRPMPDYTAQEA